MAWTLFTVATTRRTDLEEVLREDVVSRQSQKVRDAASVGGPSGETYVLVEGSEDGVRHAEKLLATVGTKVATAQAEPLYQRFKEEEDQASSGMGLFFTE